jgi:hypothetical protein
MGWGVGGHVRGLYRNPAPLGGSRKLKQDGPSLKATVFLVQWRDETVFFRRRQKGHHQDWESSDAEKWGMGPMAIRCTWANLPSHDPHAPLDGKCSLINAEHRVTCFHCRDQWMRVGKSTLVSVIEKWVDSLHCAPPLSFSLFLQMD